MFGFVLGTACLLGLVHVLHRGAHGCGWRRPWGMRGAWGCHGLGPRAMLRGLFERLDTSPGQEKVILAAVDELMTAGRAARKEAREAHEALGTAMRAEKLDPAAVASARARLQVAFDTMAAAGERALGAVHEALDPQQRRVLAELIENGPMHHGPWAGHPYRCHHGKEEQL